MKALKVGAPGGLDRLQLVDIPEPEGPAAGEIRVRLHASSLNFHDYGVVSGAIRTSDGRIPMSDGAGVVEAVGDGVTDFAAGDNIVSCFFPLWQDGPPQFGNFATVPGDGVDGYACEVVVRPASWFTHAPKGYSHPEAATLTTAGLTAWRALIVRPLSQRLLPTRNLNASALSALPTQSITSPSQNGATPFATGPVDAASTTL